MTKDSQLSTSDIPPVKTSLNYLLVMSLADAIAASTPVTTSAGRKAPVSNKNSSTEERPRNNSPAFLAYEAKKNACDARIADIRARIVIPSNYLFSF